MRLLVGAALALLAAVAALAALRVADWRALRAEWARLAALQPAEPAPFRADMVADLPEPARRYFTYMIAPDTPLLPVAEIRMEGRFGLGSREAPGYRKMRARQLLAAPEGFVWAMRTIAGLPISGSDTGRWTRFRILWLVPVARAGGAPDHRRSAFGRYVAEAAFWTPAALLPGPGVTWEAAGEYTARVTVRHDGLEQAVDVRVDAAGRPEEVVFQRWSDANPDGTYRRQPFGGSLSDFREVGGYRLPFRVEAGNLYGTEDYFPFYRAKVTEIRFPGATR